LVPGTSTVPSPISRPALLIGAGRIPLAGREPAAGSRPTPTTAVSLLQPAAETRTFTQSFGWNDLGALAWQQYPEDAAVPGDPLRTVINTYSQGALTRVCLGSLPPSPTCTSDLAGSITYHANAMPFVVTHGNGVTSTYAKDDFDMSRPKSIGTQYASANWSSGTYAYDGAGNVKTVGTDWHTYDLVSRLRSGSFTAWNQGTKTHAATYNGIGVPSINTNLTTAVDTTKARRLTENRGLSIQGDNKVGSFELEEPIALEMLSQPNPNERPNSDVVRTWANGETVNQRKGKSWVVDSPQQCHWRWLLSTRRHSSS